jgi:hypothetical protein
MAKPEIEMFKTLPAADTKSWDKLVAGEWWKGPMEKRFPVLAILARDFLPVIATEAPSERVLSRGGRLIKNGGHRSGQELLKSRTFLASADVIDEMLAVKKHKSA